MQTNSHTPTTHLVIGGARSGKSAYAECLVSNLAPPYIYIATAQVNDHEMKLRVQAHRARRPSTWQTIEEPLALVESLASLADHKRPVLVDCITLWLSNLLLAPSPLPCAGAIASLCDFLQTTSFPVFLVANEVGLGIVPDNPLGRQFRDQAGYANQQLARICNEVTLMVAGLPLKLK